MNAADVVAPVRQLRARRVPAARPGPDYALACLRRHGDHSSGFLTLNEGMEYHACTDVDGYVAYRRVGRRHAIQLCGPVAAPDDRAVLLRSFMRWGAGERLRLTAVQLTAADAQLYAEHGFTVNQLGASYSIDLARFALSGTRFMRLRNKLKRAARSGVTVEEWGWERHQEGASRAQLAEIDRAWLRAKGAWVNQLEFMVGERGGAGAQRRLLVAAVRSRPIAYVTYAPCFGARSGWLYDLTRRHPAAPAGTIELLFATAAERLRGEGSEWLHLGLTPMRQLDVRHELPDASSALVRRVLGLVAEHGALVYPARSQEQFKLKWAPHTIEPEYIGFAPRVNAGAVWRLLRLTRAI